MRYSSTRSTAFCRYSATFVTLILCGCTDTTTPPAPTALRFLAGPSYSALAGAPITPAVRVVVEDSNGQIVADATNSVTIAIENNSEGAVLTGTTTVNAVDGIATFSDLRIDKVGVSYRLSASSLNLSPAQSPLVTVAAGLPSKIAFLVQPAAAIANTAMHAFSVALQDAYGNATSGSLLVTLSLEANPGGGALTGNFVATTQNGVANFTGITITKPGQYAIRATTVLGIATSAAFDITIGPATRLGFVAFQPVAPIGATLSPVVVAVQDIGGNTIVGASPAITLALAANSFGGTLGGTTTTAAVNGVATFSDLSIGKPGAGYTLVATTPALTGSFNSPSLDVRNPLSLKNVSAGYFHSCGVTTDNNSYCWGRNETGQLTGQAQQRPAPFPTAGGLSFTSVSAGRSHSCGVTAGGAAYCWGSNAYGQLGTSAAATGLPLILPGSVAFVSIYAGYDHSCGLTIAGTAYCWGGNSQGELGVPGGGGATIAPVAGGLTFKSISPGRFFTCGVTKAGAAHCWGINSNSQLGNGTTVSANAPVLVTTQLEFREIGAGGFHSCGLTNDGKAYCWGSNGTGELGNEDPATAMTPRIVAGSLTFASLSVGNRHTCAITPAGVAYCWGDNFEGKLGDGTTTTRRTPVQVSGGLVFASISAGRFHTCGVTVDNALYCWGANFTGLLGDGTSADSNVPVLIR
jgi:alpha-tubulin suppressor-like RCC1 family protein